MKDSGHNGIDGVFRCSLTDSDWSRHRGRCRKRTSVASIAAITGIAALSERQREQVSHSHAVVSRKRQQGGVLDLAPTAVFGPSRQADVLSPAKGLLHHPISGLDAQGLSGTACSALVDRRAASAFDVLRNMRGDLERTALRDKASGAVGHMRRDPAAAVSADFVDELERRRTLGRPARLRQPHLDDQTVSILAHGVAKVREHRGGSLALSVELGLRIVGRRKRLVRAPLAAVTPIAVTRPSGRRVIVSVIRAKAPQRRLGLNYRSTDAELLVAQQCHDTRLTDERFKGIPGDVRAEQLDRAVHLCERVRHHRADRPQWVVGGNPARRGHVAEHAFPFRARSAHSFTPSVPHQGVIGLMCGALKLPAKCRQDIEKL